MHTNLDDCIYSNLVPKTSMVLAKDIMKNSKELKLKTTQYSSVPPPPPPPPLPPPPSHITSYTSKKQQLLKHVKRYAGNIKHKLRPVVPVEKRAFPIGEVCASVIVLLSHAFIL